MAETLFDVLAPHLAGSIPVEDNQATKNYLNRMFTLSVESIMATESDSLEHEAQTAARSLQALSKRSYRTVGSAAASLQHLQSDVPKVCASLQSLRTTLPSLEKGSMSFAAKYAKPMENPSLDHRRAALRLANNVDRLADMLELPTLLASTIAAAASATPTSSTGAVSTSYTPAMTTVNANYASALDLFAHIRRLTRLFPSSPLVATINLQSERAIRDMTTNLITALRSNSLKLASAMRLIGLLRRVAPELDDVVPNAVITSATSSKKADYARPSSTSNAANEGSLGALFLVCRLANLSVMLDALEPLRNLASQESAARAASRNDKANIAGKWSAGQQTERYLKRYIEIFREQCFAIVTMFKSIFPASLPVPVPSTEGSILIDQVDRQNDVQLGGPSSALCTLTIHIVDMLCGTLREFLPNIKEQSSRDSILTQVLYCASSLGRLGGDFGMMLALLEEDTAEEDALVQEALAPEWIQAMKKHRVQASRLEVLASGAGPRFDVALR